MAQASLSGTGGVSEKIDVEAIARLTAKRAQLIEQLGKMIIGQREVIDNVLLTIFAAGMG